MSQVVVADEHAILRTGLRALLERHRGLHIVAEAEMDVSFSELWKR
jgi:DNA-binding NarL/FixJ family response regulator